MNNLIYSLDIPVSDVSVILECPSCSHRLSTKSNIPAFCFKCRKYFNVKIPWKILKDKIIVTEVIL